MAIITEEPEEQQQQKPRSRKPRKKEPTSPSSPETPEPRSKPTNTQTPTPKHSSNPFVFWFYFTAFVSLITALTITLSSFSSSDDPKSFFLSLSTPLRQHYSKGRTIKVQLGQKLPPTEVFTVESGSRGYESEKVVIVHGLGLSSFAFRKVVDFLGSNGVHGVLFDLPGNGFSDKSMEVSEERGNGVFHRFLDVYGLVREKGIFWAFDNMVETGEIPYEEIQAHFSRDKSVVKPIALGGEEMGRVLGQVIETMGLAPVHLVLHDSSLGMLANWLLENSALVRSVTLVDTGSRPAFSSWVLQLPLVREVVLGSNFLYGRLISMCCWRGIGGSDVEAHRLMLKGRDGARAVVGTARKLNSSFDIAEWGGSDGIKEMPMQVIWSSSWSKEWSEVGHGVAKALPRAKFVSHTGGRWPQEDTANELAENIANFVSSLPKSVRQTEEEPTPEHIQKMLDEAEKDGHHHHHHHHHHGHSGHDHHHGHAHLHSAGHMDAYGLGHGWGS